MRSRSALQLRSAIFATVAALALGLAACGGSDDSGADSTGSTTGGSDSDREEASAAVEDLYAAVQDRDAEAVCERLSPAMQKQFAAGGLGPKTGSCETSFQRYLDKADQGQFDSLGKAKVRSVEVTGDKAVAKVAFGGNGSGQVPLQKVEGEWRLASASATPSK